VVNGEIVVDKFDMIMSMLGGGFALAMFVVVIVAAIRAGWSLWPWVLGLGAIAYLFL
jgi:hypothetical protein